MPLSQKATWDSMVVNQLVNHDNYIGTQYGWPKPTRIDSDTQQHEIPAVNNLVR